MTSIGRSGDSRENVDRLFVRRGRPRVAAALHGLAFFLAVAAAPHSHLNSFEDLLSDESSDSGVFVEYRGAPKSGLWLCAARLVGDNPCLACFQNDFQSTTVSVFLIAPTYSPLAGADEFLQPPQPGPPIARSRSRAPPLNA